MFAAYRASLDGFDVAHCLLRRATRGRYSGGVRWALPEGRGSTGGKRRQLRHASVDVELVTAELDHLAEEAVDGVRINPRISLLSEIEEYF